MISLGPRADGNAPSRSGFSLTIFPYHGVLEQRGAFCHINSSSSAPVLMMRISVLGLDRQFVPIGLPASRLLANVVSLFEFEPRFIRYT